MTNAAGAKAAPASEPAPLSEGQRALAEAKESGQRVEVAGQRSERTTVFANPDGFTFTLEESSVPVRVATGQGGWQDPDPTLVRRSDGSVGPKAAAAEMSFSGGGDGDPLAEIADQGRSLELRWSGKLPEPRLDGPSALYADVLPDVDLKVTATPESFQHVLVVKTPKAATLPELKELNFGLKSKGLTVRKGAAGNLAAVDGDGRTVFRAPPAQMWNSAGKAEDGQQPAAMKLSAASAPAAPAASTDETPTRTPTDPSESAPSGSGLEPGQGDDVARMDVRLSKDSLSVVPDAELLNETDPAAFPLFIDPTVTWGESERTLLRSDGYESYGWGNGSDDRGKGAGKCGTWNGYYCGPGYVQRLYFEFSPASLKGKKILDATFRVTEPWAFQCDPRPVDLWRTNNISSSTTWSSRPTHLDFMGDRWVSAGRGSLCDPNSPDAPIEFHDNPQEPNENLTPTVANFAAGKFSRLTLMIKAHDESDTSAWKRFKNDAVLAVDFVGLPAKPTAVGLVTGSGTVCETKEYDPAIVSDPTPALTATAQTAAGGEKDAQLRVSFDLDHKNSDGTWSDTPAGNGDVRPSSGFVGDNTKVTLSWSTLSEGKLYRYRTWVRSYYNSGKSNLNSPEFRWCYFKVDPTAPKAPKITVGAPYTECTPNACAPSGGPGQKASFTFAPASGDGNDIAYQYKLSSGAAWSAEQSGSKVTVSTTPGKAGTHRVYVRAKDDVGRWGAQNLLDFLVAAGEGPVGRWHFDEATGVAKDSATAGGAARHDATLSAGAVRDDRGRRGLITHDAQGQPLATPVTDRGLALNGSTGHAATAGPVVETRSSYTVSAWARLDSDPGRNVTVLGQNGSFYSGFYLSYQGDKKTWTLRTSPKDATDGNIGEQIVVAKQPATFGVWTHLAAVYDAAAGEIRLYVNGRLQGTDGVGSPWDASGPLQIGRVLWRGDYTDYFNGSIDEVAAWQRALLPDEIAQEARLLTSEHFTGAELVADWSASHGSGASIADTTSGYGRSLALTGGASIQDGEIALDGVDDAATATGPVIDDTGSFTVTTLAALDGDKLAAKEVGYTGQVLGQRTADGSAWGFWFQMTGKETVVDEETLEERTVPVGLWHFGRLSPDGTFSSVASDEAAAVDASVRLTGVFDAQAGEISLFVGYDRNGEPTAFTAEAGSGDFAIGRGLSSGTWAHHLPARVAEVRLWAGAMAGLRQIELTVGD
ncbi:LamG-like jellyroll fold domain-containing protein [Streptomyces sp. MUM 178J]|nr:LamG-like jellyroll fold domain-containing protein [Streptomyces sp. MUM 178J]WRQ83303.1 LamG-like jellyroll fold domain-containing protein [Streptomyces sp. MUM 178J]